MKEAELEETKPLNLQFYFSFFPQAKACNATANETCLN